APLQDNTRQKELEEELAKVKATKTQLISELKQQGEKQVEGDRLKNENERLKLRMLELSTELSQLKQQAEKQKQIVKIDPEQTAKNLQAIEELKNQKTELEQELHEAKQRTLRFICDKKEIDDKILSLNNEKATFLARLRDLAQKNSSLEEEERVRKQKIQELEAALEKAHELQTEKELVHELLREENEALKGTVEKLQMNVDEQMRAYTAIDEHTKLLEQHLARRVKECAIFSKQLEEESAKQSALLATHEAQLKTIHSLEGALEQSKKNELAQKEQHLALEQQFGLLTNSWQAQNSELQHLKKTEIRLAELEQLFNQFGELLVKPIAPEQPRAQPVSQKELFTPSVPPPRVSRSLFD
ncbi:MAG: hypothetical protein JSR46_02235, partial [Verrucomicrobia bacterium]|nr:hypothetical protein [Verrucomicrobiota bacterium]